jgi:NTE family protein
MDLRQLKLRMITCAAALCLFARAQVPLAEAQDSLARAQDPAPATKAPLGIAAEPQPRVASTSRPRVALVLSSGGARGLAHIGVLQALEAQHVEVDLIVGSEWGALVGGLYAAGLSPEEIQGALLAPDWIAALRNRGRRQSLSIRAKQEDREFLIDLPLGLNKQGLILPPGLYGGARMRQELARLTLRTFGTSHFDDLPCAFRAVATELEHGNAVTLDAGSLAQAIEASLSTPVLWPPVELNGQSLVSGALSAALPIGQALESGAETLIVVDLVCTDPRDESASFVDVGARLLELTAARRSDSARAVLRAGDVLCAPEVQGLDLTDFANAAELVRRGHAAAAALRERLAVLALDPAVYAEHQQQRRVHLKQQPRLDRVHVDPSCVLSEAAVLARMELREGQAMDPAAASRDLALLYGLRIFQRVDFDLRATQLGHADLTVRTEDLPTAPLYWRSGLTVEGSAGDGVNFVIGAGIRYAPTDAWGSEGRLLAEVGNRYRFLLEYHQALEPSGKWFLVPSATWEQRPVQVDTQSGAQAEFKAQELDLGLDVAREIGNNWEVRAGFAYRSGRSSLEIGDTSDSGEGKFDESGFRSRLLCDSLDDTGYPTTGTSLRAEWFLPFDNGDGTDETAQLRIDRALPMGQDSLVLGAELNTILGDPQNVTSFSPLGGFLRLSGLAPEAISGPAAALARAVYIHPWQARSLESRLFTWYGGASLEWGNVFPELSDFKAASLLPSGSVFLGVDTFIGPAYLGYGLTDGGEHSVFFYFGSVF